MKYRYCVRGSQSKALSGDVDYVTRDENRVIDTRGGVTTFGHPLGRALAFGYEMDHEDDRTYGIGQTGECGFIPYPE